MKANMNALVMSSPPIPEFSPLAGEVLDDKKSGGGMNHRTILLVDDNPAIVRLLTRLLVQDDYIVQTATRGVEALEVLACTTPDAVLTDIQMPGMSGIELTRLIRSDPRTSDALILAVSANAKQADIDIALFAGFDGYITAPVDTRTFAAEVGGYLKRGRTKQPLLQPA